MYVYPFSSMILSYLYFKIFYKNSKFWFPAVFLFQARPADRTGRPELVSRTTRLCMSVGRPLGRPTESSFALGFSGSTARSTARSTAFRKLCFILEDGRPERSTRAQRLLPAGRTADRTGRPPGLQSPNGSFLFGAI